MKNFKIVWAGVAKFIQRRIGLYDFFEINKNGD
jgi:hypothetical protein